MAGVLAAKRMDFSSSCMCLAIVALTEVYASFGRDDARMNRINRVNCQFTSHGRLLHTRSRRSMHGHAASGPASQSSRLPVMPPTSSMRIWKRSAAGH